MSNETPSSSDRDPRLYVADMLEFTQRAMAPDIPWRQIVATRNRFAHAYLGIAPKTVWSILCDDLPPMVAALPVLITALGPADPV